jgi:hypothetical protein
LETKFNLTVIDKNPDIKNFVYAGVPHSFVDKVKTDFKNQNPVIEFIYDEGEVLISLSEIHSIVVSEYISAREMEEPIEEDI